MQPKEFLQPYPLNATIQTLPPRPITSKTEPAFATTATEALKPAWEQALALGSYVEGFLLQPPSADGSLAPLSMTTPQGETVAPSFDRGMRGYFDDIENIIYDGSHDLRLKGGAVKTEILRYIRENSENGAYPRSFADIEDKDIRGVVLERIQDIARIGAELRGEAKFHLLTMCMMPMWKPLLDGEWPKHNSNQGERYDRTWWITRAQQDIAMHGMRELNHRRKMVEAKGQENYFSKAFAPVRLLTEGSGAEYDVAIQLLEAVKQAMIEDPELELTVIPAPPQFEQSIFTQNPSPNGEKPKNPNVDFLVINLRTHEVAGVQVKNSRSTKAEQKYDTESGRVTILYGEDIAEPVSIKTPNTNQFTKDGKPVMHTQSHSWFGRLSTAVMKEIPTYGPDAARVFPWRENPEGFSRKDGSRKFSPPGRRSEVSAFRNQMKLLARAAVEHAVLGAGANWDRDSSLAAMLTQSVKVPAIKKILAEVGAPVTREESVFNDNRLAAALGGIVLQ